MTESNAQFKYAQVLVDLDAKSLDRRTFSYGIPEGMEGVLEVGTPVSVPFGRMKLITGYVVGFTNYVAPGIRIKEITDILDEEPLFDLEYLNFLDWLANYTATPLMTVLSAALPSSMIQKTRREVILENHPNSPETTYQLPRPAQQILAYLTGRPRGKGVRVRYLASQTGLPLKLVNQTLYKLRQDGYIRLQSATSGAMGQKRIKWVRRGQGVVSTGMTKRQTEVFERLLESMTTEEITLSDASALAQTTTATLQKIAEHGALEIFEAPVHRDRDPLAFYGNMKTRTELILNPEQQRAAEIVLASDPASQHLLYGITGSGKTEVYLYLTEQMLAQGKSVMILVPEISLTSHIAKRFIEKFGLDQLALWHSQLSDGEKVDSWRRIHQGELKIVIGARSAIFTPVQDLGLIVMDEEHEGSFKQESPAPRYHAKVLAQELVRRTEARLVLGSATPDVETYWRSRQEDHVLRLSKRYGGRSLADVTVVDMREARANGHIGSLSASLRVALEEAIIAGQQAIILLNRRGFYTLIMCENCEEIFQCPHCSVALTYHRYRERVRCHYCGFDGDKPQFCPHCASFKLTFAGTGTQRLEDEIADAMPDVRTLRLDSDVMQKKFAHRDVFEAFGAHEADILIGTQMVAKGLDIPNVTLVGVVSADTAFSLPDYKASERGFQLLTQVAGRSGRGDKPGRVIIQTQQPHHPVILRAKDQDYEGFYEDELIRRQEFDFPPYSQLFRMIASCPDEFRARNFMKAVAINFQQILNEATLEEVVTMLGPAPCVIGRIQGRYRYHLMIKNRYGELGHQMVTKFFSQVQAPEDLNFLLDTDAQSFL
jgi:primosomal protein N' (replication factor Y) (superfamily II helicase)